MTRRRPSARDLALVAGTLACAYGLAVLAVPAAAVAVPLSTPVVALAGLLALVAAGVGLARRLRGSRPLPSPPATPDYRSPGADWRDRLAATSPADGDARAAVRDDLADAAVDALAARGVPPERARERVARGAWTDDPLAAAYLRGDPPRLAERLRALAGGPAPFRRRARRAMAAVAELRERDGDPVP